MASTMTNKYMTSLWLLAFERIAKLQLGSAQAMAGVYDFGLGRYGEKRGDWTPSEWLAAVLIVMTICMGLAISIGLCYYVNKRQTRVTGSVVSGRRYSLDSQSIRRQYASPGAEQSEILVAQI